MQYEAKKMKPRRATDAVESRLRTVSIVMVLCLLMLIGILVAVNTGKGKKGRLTAQTSTQGTTSQPSTPTASVESIQVPPLTIYRRRNIFRPLVNMEAGQSQATTGGGTAGGGTAGGAASVITLPPELDATGSVAGSVVSTAVTLENISQEGDSSMARIRVGDQLYDKVAIGDVFGNNYKLLAIGKDSSATILYGDERFTIFAGQSLYL